MKRLIYILLIVTPFVGLLYPPLYNRVEPALWGFPFFYWYQLAWVFITSLMLFAAYLLKHRGER